MDVTIMKKLLSARLLCVCVEGCRHDGGRDDGGRDEGRVKYEKKRNKKRSKICAMKAGNHHDV